MKTAESLRSLSVKDLAQLAKKRGVAGWHSLRKDQLVRALARIAARQASATAQSGGKASRPARRAAKSTAATASRNGASRGAASANGRTHVSQGIKQRGSVSAQKTKAVKAPPPPRPKSPAVLRKLRAARERMEQRKNLARSAGGSQRDRLVVMVRDPYWLHAYWELTRQGVQRAEAALGQEWHTARPVLRLLDVSSHGTTSTSETVLRHIEIHGGVNNWYIDVADPPRTYRVDVGYLSAEGKFFMLARSNVVSTPRAGASDSLDENWTDVAENFDKIYAMSGGYSSEVNGGELQELFEERLRRPMGSPVITRFGAGADVLLAGRNREFRFEMDAELIVFGATEPGAHVTLQGDPVQLRPDGTFTVRFSLPNCRQVIPAVASSPDGVEQRTIVLAVERNTKVMEPVSRDSND